MIKNRTYTIGLGSVALTAIAMAVAFPAKSPVRLIQAASNADQTTANTNNQQPQTSVKVNGEPVQLDDQGNAKVQTPNGGTVDVSAKNRPVTSAPKSDSANQNINYHVESVSGGTGQNSSTTSTSINISGNSSTSATNSSRTTVSGDGTDTIEVHSN